MQFIIAPAKKMQVDVDTFAPETLPENLTQTTEILTALRALTPDQRQKLWQCSDKLAATSEQQLAQLNLKGPLTPAIIAFVGIQYQSMAPDLFTESALQYIQAHLRILSGFYRALRPFDGVDTHFIPTRFQAKAANNSRHGQPARRNYLPLFICTLIQQLRIQKEEPLPYTV